MMTEIEKFYLLNDNWDKIKKTVKDTYDISNVAYDTFIDNMKLDSISENTVYIIIPNKKSIISFITKSYTDFFTVTVTEFINDGISYNVIFKSEEEDVTQKTNTTKLDFNLIEKSNLNPKFTFDNFVRGDNNSFALEASVAVANAPGIEFNPLFIYGNSGLGKTHLLHSIGHYILEKDNTKNVLYVNCKSFLNELIPAISGGKQNIIDAFRKKYLSVDILLFDDIQFIKDKKSSMEEFFYTFEYLCNNNKAIVISSDKPPKEFEDFDERYISRFSMGLIADIQPPSYETRYAILQKLNSQHNNIFNDEVLSYISTNVDTDIRSLEGAYKNVIQYARIYGIKDITIEHVNEAIKEYISFNKKRPITPQKIMNAVAEHYNIDISELLSSSRRSEVVFPRQIIYYLCSTMTGETQQNIAKLLDRKDHSTVISGSNKIKEKVEKDENFRNEIEVIKNKIIFIY